MKQKIALISGIIVLVMMVTNLAMAASLAEQLIGYWTLVSIKNEQDGKITDSFGPNPKGLYIFDRSGRYVLLLFRPDIPKFASNSRDKGTPEENKAVVVGSLVHYGTYTVNEKEGSISVLPEAGTYPNWVGVEQKRFFSISGDELRMNNPAGSRGGVTRMIFKRAK